jgi:ribosomal protein S17E
LFVEEETLSDNEKRFLKKIFDEFPEVVKSDQVRSRKKIIQILKSSIPSFKNEIRNYISGLTNEYNTIKKLGD